jgi:hypothetical protein
MWLSIVYAIEAPVGIFRIFRGIFDFLPDIKALLGETGWISIGVIITIFVILILTPF